MGEQYKYVIKSPPPHPWPLLLLLLTRKKLRLTHTLEPVSFFPLLLLNSYTLFFLLGEDRQPIKTCEPEGRRRRRKRKKRQHLWLYSLAHE
jgi:hypothetical protein